MTKRMIIMLVVVGVILGGVFGFEIFRGIMIKKFMSSMGMPVSTVSAMAAAYQDWQPQQDAVGTLRAKRGVDVSNELAGVVDEIHFESGGDVKEGDLLVKMRADDSEAQLQVFKAAAQLAATNYERDKKQFEVQAVAQATLDTDLSTLNGAKAQVAEQQAIVDKKYIRAPFSGHLGVRNIDIGQYLTAGSAIVTLQDLDNLFIDFFLPQQALSQLKVGQKITVRSDTWPDKNFEGAITVINPKVDPSTRNVQIRAELPNPEHALLPGMYATARIDTGAPQRFLTVPQTAVTYNPYGNTVFVIEDKDNPGKPPADALAAPKKAEGEAQAKPGEQPKSNLVAKQVFVTTGETRGDQVAILKGINEGDIVVISGQLKLMNGAPVVIDNSVTPSHDAAPKPEDK